MLNTAGEELASLTGVRWMELRDGVGSVTSLKRHLRNTSGSPESMQQLLHESRCLDDMEVVDAPMDLQLVLVSVPPTRSDFLDAAEHGNIAVVRYLLERGVNMNVRMLREDQSYDGVIRYTWRRTSPALFRACATGHLDVVRLLLEERADTSFKGWGTALREAIAHDRVEVVRMLLAAGVGVDEQDGDVVRDHTWVQDLLTEAGVPRAS